MKTRSRGILLIVFLAVAGCVAAPAPEPRRLTANIDSTALSFDLIEGGNRWEREAAKRYDDAIVVMVHGLTNPTTGEWYAYPSVGPAIEVRDLIERLRKHHPRRRIVLGVCNPDGLRLRGVSNVSYALENIWMVPDELAGFKARDAFDPKVVGSIWEFHEQ